jgi:hypothetical protein
MGCKDNPLVVPQTRIRRALELPVVDVDREASPQPKLAAKLLRR